MLSSFSSWNQFVWSEDITHFVDLLSKSNKIASYFTFLFIKTNLVYEFPKDLFLVDDEILAAQAQMSLDDLKLFKLEISNIMLGYTINNCILPKSKLHFGLSRLDRLIGNGLPSNSVVEFYGSAGSGKTQVALQLVSNILKTEHDSKILYICTQERFSIDRLISMLGPSFDSTLLDRLHIEYFLDSEVEMHFFKYSLHAMVQEFNYKLIVYDGIASNIRSIENIFDLLFIKILRKPIYS